MIHMLNEQEEWLGTQERHLDRVNPELWQQISFVRDSIWREIIHHYNLVDEADRLLNVKLKRTQKRWETQQQQLLQKRAAAETKWGAFRSEHALRADAVTICARQ
jgi:hypothetical protein